MGAHPHSAAATASAGNSAVLTSSLAIPLAVAAGGAVGAVARHYLGTAIMRLQADLGGGSFPTGIFAINILGSFAIGLLAGGLAERLGLGATGRALLQTGLLGGFTTFSTYALDSWLLWERGQGLQAAAYVIGSVVLALAGLWLGLRLGQALAAQ